MNERRKAANRRNARKSTGPRSPEGKAVVAGNALRHGLLAKHALLPEEDVEAFEQLRDGVLDELRPEGALETEYAEEIVAGLWRLRRARDIEAGLLAWQQSQVQIDRIRNEMKEMERRHNINHPLVSEDDPGEFGPAEESRTEAMAQQEQGLARLGGAFLRDAGLGDGLGKLSRYETTIRRAIDRALSELERMQQARRGRQESAGDTSAQLMALPVSQEGAGSAGGDTGS